MRWLRRFSTPLAREADSRAFTILGSSPGRRFTGGGILSCSGRCGNSSLQQVDDGVLFFYNENSFARSWLAFSSRPSHNQRKPADVAQQRAAAIACTVRRT
jgi:hypothetical protein